MIDTLQEKLAAADRSTDDTVKKNVRAYCDLALDAAKSKGRDYAFDYYKSIGKIQTRDQLTNFGGRTHFLKELKLDSPTTIQNARDTYLQIMNTRIAELEAQGQEAEPGESSSSAQTDANFIAETLKLVQELPKKLAEYRLKNRVQEEKKELAALDVIQKKYSEVYDRNKSKDNESIKEITAILKAGAKIPLTDEATRVIDLMMSPENLEKTVKQIDELTKAGKEALKESNIKPEQKKAIEKQLTLLKQEKEIIQKLIATDDLNATFAHAIELWEERTALTKELEKAKKNRDETNITRIKKEIELLYKRAPHLLPAYEEAIKSREKTFLPKNIKAYIEAKRDEILEKKRQESKK